MTLHALRDIIPLIFNTLKMDTATKYDTLANFESRFSKRNKTYAVHKKLQFERDEPYSGIEDINDWLAINFPLKNDAQLLDAGCGNGKTIFTFAKMHNINGYGISLSKNEIDLAEKAVSELNMSNRCFFQVKSYDEPLTQKFDQIIAIESLKHSKDLKFSLQNLASSLKPSGLLIIVEDIRKGNLPNNRFFNLLLKNWSMIDLFDKEAYCDAAKITGLTQTKETDFTHLVKMRKAWWSFCLVYFLQLIKNLTPFSTTRKIISIFQAGFALEYYYKKGFMEYKVLIFNR